jgi:hypothetical protein
MKSKSKRLSWAERAAEIQAERGWKYREAAEDVAEEIGGLALRQQATEIIETADKKNQSGYLDVAIMLEETCSGSGHYMLNRQVEAVTYRPPKVENIQLGDTGLL